MTFDPDSTSIAELRSWVEDCGYHCAGRSVPGHLCDRPTAAVVARRRVRQCVTSA